ncbi:MAG TPA: hypothetical protein VGJ28_12535, partial [Micromonosporaceae bacterium]
MPDLGSQSGQGVRFAASGTVFFNDGAQLWIAVEGGAAEAAASSDVVEGDWLSGKDQFGAGILEALAPIDVVC